MEKTVYSVVISHEGEVHYNFLYVDKESALAKVEEVKKSWELNNVSINKYSMDETRVKFFGVQYGTKQGYWYMNHSHGDNSLYEYGSVDLIECVLE
jgi:hypothetical protein